jgi:hypothetical protein
VVVDDLDVMGISISPSKANPPLPVDPNAVLSRAVASQDLQPVARRRAEIGKRAGIVYLRQLAVRRPDDVVRHALDEAALPGGFGGGIAERSDREGRYYRIAIWQASRTGLDPVAPGDTPSKRQVVGVGAVLYICFAWHGGNAFDVEITDYH